MSVRMSTTIRGKRDFFGPQLRYRSIFFVQIPVINKHLFCKYFVRLSVGNATKVFATYGCFQPCLYLNAHILHITQSDKLWKVYRFCLATTIYPFRPIILIEIKRIRG